MIIFYISNWKKNPASKSENTQYFFVFQVFDKTDRIIKKNYPAKYFNMM